MRSFIAVSIQPNDAITSLMKAIEPLKGSKVPHNRLMHMTLAFLDEISEDEKNLICSILSGITYQSFQLKTTHVGAFPDLRKARVAFIGVDSPEVVQLQKILMERLPEKFREKRDFVPHLTVSRFKRPPDIRGLIGETGNADFGDYKVDKLTLYRSELTPQGAIYTEICSAQLI
ncbi:hypothetical protein IX51_00880 [uncultured archaeon]|nr:hypothetical protein IX51_00880 [uncultured archaeon]